MPIMNWDQTLDVGVESMNSEHREILDAMNRIYDADQTGQHGDVINSLVGRLGSVCVRHFADEEKFMAKIGFPTLENHKLVHAKLLRDFSAHAAAIKAADGTVTEGFFTFLKFWLSAHIKGIDIKYGAHAKAVAAR